MASCGCPNNKFDCEMWFERSGQLGHISHQHSPDSEPRLSQNSSTNETLFGAYPDSMGSFRREYRKADYVDQRRHSPSPNHPSTPPSTESPNSSNTIGVRLHTRSDSDAISFTNNSWSITGRVGSVVGGIFAGLGVLMVLSVLWMNVPWLKRNIRLEKLFSRSRVPQNRSKSSPINSSGQGTPGYELSGAAYYPWNIATLIESNNRVRQSEVPVSIPSASPSSVHIAKSIIPATEKTPTPCSPASIFHEVDNSGVGPSRNSQATPARFVNTGDYSPPRRRASSVELNNQRKSGDSAVFQFYAQTALAPQPSIETLGSDNRSAYLSEASVAKGGLINRPHPSSYSESSSSLRQSHPLHMEGSAVDYYLSPHTATVLRPFVSTDRGKLSVTAGDVIRVLAEYDDGFALCLNQRGKQGMVPMGSLDFEPASSRKS
ncbi:hypothetical protein BDQ12DRAFT_736962 [Crucibulum laeve]|uniref:SH3 domain-containing protein n=1 Tax=Crucibulum laeve TaxID=68775 RepID=A0A5C3LTU8_9AGAR|nr:hypothetical protein BDQ12DRAFT_736962 [Crucibulum laeve]